MSETETHIGKLIEYEALDNESLNDTVKRLIVEVTGRQPKKHSDDPIELMYLNIEGKAVIAGDKLYKIIKNKEYEYEDICYATKNNDGSISYVLKFYNGACDFGEALTDAINSMKDDAD